MNNKSMTESELIEFLTALRDNCGNKRKTQWYDGLIEDIGIAFTDDIPDGDMLEEAKKLWQNGNKLEAVKLMCQSGYRLKEAKNYCDENFGLLPNLAKSTENLSKIKNKDEWLDEVRGKDELSDKFKSFRVGLATCYLSDKESKECAKIAKQYTNSKLEEIEKWCDEEINTCKYKMTTNDRMFWAAKESVFNEVKEKIKFLKQES